VTALVKHDQAVATGALHVLFTVGATEYGIAADTVLQMETFSGATSVPGTAPYVAGVVQIRGRVIPLVDLRIRFGESARERDADTRIVVGQRGDRVVGLLVDRAREVITIPADKIQPPPPILDQMARGFVVAIAHLEGRVVLLVDFAKIIGEEGIDVVQ
jgi:purine-binding chemotaxis protein CheW